MTGVERLERRLPVATSTGGYEVVIGRGLLRRAGETLAPLLPQGRTAIVTDAHVAPLYGEPLRAALAGAGVAANLIVLPPGEATKSFAELERLIGRLLALRLERRDRIVALGGGVVGDLAGFAAAVYKRGIDYIQIPTTLLAQVDSSVGGKTAIDTAGGGKNLVGAFHPPAAVLADLAVLDTLPEREMRAGYAEVLKYGLLGDAGFFCWLEENGPGVLERAPAPLLEAVARSVAMKAEIVGEDEREAGRRALLNLGHTFGHALESESGLTGALLHGEAVALGCVLAFDLSVRLGHCPVADAERVRRAVEAAGLPWRLRQAAGAPFDAERLLAHMLQDKKADGGLTLVLARGIGRAFVSRGVEPAAVCTHLAEAAGN